MQNKTLQLIRSCFKELRCHELIKQSQIQHFCWRRSPVYNYICDMARSDATHEDYSSLESYVTLLHGSRRAQELIIQYRGVGERSIEETARIVGLKLPILYEDKDDVKL